MFYNPKDYRAVDHLSFIKLNGNSSYLSMYNITKDVLMTQVGKCRCAIKVMVNTITTRTKLHKRIVSMSLLNGNSCDQPQID
jgi:hypothetical protein